MSDHRSRDDVSQPGHAPRDPDEDAANESTWDGSYDGSYDAPADVDDLSDAEGIVHDWEIYPESIGAGAS
jgi:hypothetical protein